jgi:type I restriction enzyme S subunit
MNSLNVPKLRFPGFDGEWEKSTLGEAFSIFNGYAFSSTSSVDEGVLWVKIADVGIQKMKKNNLSYLPTSLKEKHKKFIISKGDFVVALTRPILNGKLKIAQINSFFDGALLNQRVGKIVSNNSHYFIYSLLQKDELIKSIENNIAGSDPPNLSPNEINSIEISYPPLPEQQKIASFLSAVDEKIQQLSRKKELLEQYKKGVMQQLFSGKLRFKDENGKDHADWEEKKLGDVCTNISYGMNAAATTYDGQNKYLRITDIDESSDGLNLDKLTSPNGLLEDKFRVKEGDLLFARTGASVGKTYLYRNSDGILYFAGFLIRFRVKGAIPAFIYLQTQTSKYNKWVKVMSMRSGQPGINAEEYKIFEISLPCHEEQQKIANFLSGIDAKIEQVNGELVKTQEFKKGLLQQLFV